MATNIDIEVTKTEYTVDITVEPNEYIVNITTSTGGGGVQTVTGDLVDNTDPLNPIIETPNLTQVLTVGDVSSWFEHFPSFPPNPFITLQLGRELTSNYYNTLYVGTGGLFLDKTIIFPENSTITFQAGYVEDNPVPAGSTLYPYRFTTDAYVFYQGAIITDITIQPEDVCTLKWGGYNSTDGIQIWFLTIVSRGSSVTPSTLISTDADNALTVGTDSKLFVPESNPKTFNRTQGIYYFEEFMGNQGGAIAAAYSNVITLVSGNGTARSVATTNRTNQQGIIQHSTGTAATNFGGYSYGSSLYIGSGTISIETYVTIETLSNATQRFFTYFGYAGGSSNYLNIPSGIFFSYDEGGVVLSSGIATPNWKCYTRASGGTVTVTTTSIPVVANQWYKLRIDINAAGTSVTFFINDVLVATHTTNIPSSTTVIAPISIIHKSAGTTARTMLTDYFMYEEIFTNER